MQNRRGLRRFQVRAFSPRAKGSKSRNTKRKTALAMNLDFPRFSRFTHEGLELAYFDEGDPSGDPVLLTHGFASSANVNWVFPGWLKTLGDAGYRVIAIDNRGHGASAKPHDPALYTPPLMAGDAAALLDHLRISEAHVFG